MNKILDLRADKTSNTSEGSGSPHLWQPLFVSLISQPQGAASCCDLLERRGLRRETGQRAEKSYTSQSQGVKGNEVFSVPESGFLQVTEPRAVATKKIRFASGTT